MVFFGSNSGNGDETTLFLYLFLLLSPFITNEIWCGIACLSNPCVHGVCLDDWNSTYFCYCIDGYTGVQCQTNWNECWSSPCQHGGVCIDGIATFNCSCPPGFTGDLCEEDINECDSNPCMNNGTCSDITNGYICNCPAGYSGVLCEIDIAVCNATNETRCANGGICVDGPGESFTCICPPGYQDSLCTIEIDECQSSPCQNGGVCIDLIAEYSCACSFGYSGRNCEDIVRLCEKNPCRNGALCLIENGQAVCYCVPDFHGDLCQYQYDECQIGPKCLNGGTCIDGIDNSTCSCPPKLTGLRCECLILDDNELDCNYISPKPTATTTKFVLSSSTEQDTSTTITRTTEIETTTSTENLTTTEISTTVLTTTEITTVPSTQTSTEEIETYTPSSSFSTSSTSSISSTSSTSTISSFETTETSTNSFTTTETATETTSFSTVPISTTETEYSTTTSTTIETTTQFLTPQEETTSTTTTTTLLTEQPTESTTDTTEISTTTTETSSDMPFDCTQPSSYCLNGGSCVFTQEIGYSCLCPFDTEGQLCEVHMGIRRPAFTGKSYLSHYLPERSNLSIEFEAKTLAPNGLWYYSNLDKAYMVLYTEEGFLKFRFSCGYQTMLLSELKIPVNTGYLQKIEAKLEFSQDWRYCDASIKVNDSLAMAGDQIAVLNHFTLTRPSSWLHLGNVPDEFFVENLPKDGFIGCMENLKISHKVVNIFKDAESGFGVIECSSLACLSNPCLNGATCLSKGDQWSCSCKNGFLGTLCHLSVCDDNPCLYGGTCIPFSGSGYICLCPYGKHGHFCENDIKINEPYFTSSIHGLSSYVAYPIPGAISQTMELRFRFVPSMTDQISILMFIGQKGYHDFYSDHMAVSFVKGFIMLTWNLGSGPRRIFTSQPIQETDKSYLVRLGRTGRRAWLYVENIGNVTGRSPGNLVHLDVLPVIYLGGHDSTNFSTLPHDLPLHTGFFGCIFDVQLVSDSVLIPLQISQQTQGRAVGQCGTNECYEQSCQNKGACLHHGSTFMCLCQDGWFGPMCTSKFNPCDFAKNQCSSGSTCVPLISGYECDCPLGKTGKFCQHDEDITDVGFTGKRSYLSLKLEEIKNNQFTIEFEIRPLSDNGVIVFFGKSGISFLSLTLINSLLELKILTSDTKSNTNDPVTITTTKILVKGIWYKIQISIFGKNSYISIDNVIKSKTLPSDRGIYLIDNDKIYLGGLPDLSKLPILATSNPPVPFHGCIRHFFVNSQQIPLVPSNIYRARNINDCDGTACGRDACLNGGTCWLDSFMKAHCSCLTPYYGDRCELVPECEEKLCNNVGTCDVNGRCLCKIGYSGNFCQNRINLTMPEFNGESYLIMRRNYEKKRNIEDYNLRNLYLNFTTVKKNALLLWSRKGDNFIGVGIDGGFLKIVEKLDKNFVDLPTSRFISDGLWHSLEIKFLPLKIKLDQNRISYNNSAFNSTLAFSSIFIGGIDTTTTITKETYGQFSENFAGCIEGFSVNSHEIIRDFTKFQGVNVETCRIS